MKKIFNITFLITLFLLISCATKTNENFEDNYSDDDYGIENNVIEAPQSNDNFIGDFDPIKMQDFIFLQKSKKTVKPKEIKSVYLVPRTNTIELTFRDSVNEITFALNKYEREKLIKAGEAFLEQYDSRTVPHQKINSKTAYYSSKTPLWFGVLNSATSCTKNDYYTNCEFIDKKPYFLIKFVPSRTDNGQTFTPKLSLYMSPTQLREFVEVIKQENLNILVEEFKTKAYTY